MYGLLREGGFEMIERYKRDGLCGSRVGKVGEGRCWSSRRGGDCRKLCMH